MSSGTTAWLWGWFPSIPPIPSFDFANLSLPSSIQSRFVSFVLKRSLGHLLKPGQLDSHKIDSQISNGFVEVRGLELDPSAINAYLTDLPFRMDTGFVGMVTAHFPWPNPFSGTLGLSVEDIHLTFLFDDDLYSSPAPDLGESVASVAESFIQDELTSQEGAALRESFHPDVFTMSPNPNTEDTEPCLLPGSINPFFQGRSDDEHNELAVVNDLDPAGISIFASLLEKLLSRFRFDSRGIRISLIYPSQIRLTLCLDEIHYGRNEPHDENATADGHRLQALRMIGVNVLIGDLTQSNTTSSVVSNSDTSPRSRPAADSDIDETIQAMMSQSLVSLPPKFGVPSSPTSSIYSETCSLYESAIASTPSLLPQAPAAHSTTKEAFSDAVQEDDMLLALGAQPLVFTVTSPITLSNTTLDSPMRYATSAETLGIDFDGGVFACCIRPWHLRAVAAISNCFGGTTSQGSSKAKSDDTRPQMKLSIQGRMRGVVVLLAPKDAIFDVADAPQDDQAALQHFFSKPLIPPTLRNPYVRLHMDNIKFTLSTTTNASSATHACNATLSTLSSTCSPLFTGSVSDINILAFHPSTSPNEITSSPILITDPHLSSSYRNFATHFHPVPNHNKEFELPVFDVSDWTRCANHGTKIKPWRTKLPQLPQKSRSIAVPSQATVVGSPEHGPSHLPAIVSEDPDISSPPSPPPLHIPAISINCSTRHHDPQTSCDIALASLHLFGDISSMEILREFLENINWSTTSYQQRHACDAEKDDCSQRRVETAFGHLEGSDHERRDPRSYTPRMRVRTRSLNVNDDTAYHEKQATIQKREKIYCSIRVPIVRLELRVPPPHDLPPRSGPLVFDVHDLNFSNFSAQTSSMDAIVTDTTDQQSKKEPVQMVAFVQFHRVVLAYALINSSKATSVLSVGCAHDSIFDTAGNQHESSEGMLLLPKITIQQRNTTRSQQSPLRTPSSYICNIDLPSVYFSLSKPYYDGLQLWADDANRLYEHLMAKETGRNKGSRSSSRLPSMLGSRFFSEETESMDSNAGSSGFPQFSVKQTSRISIKLNISELAARLVLFHSDSANEDERLVEIAASDMDLHVQMNPEEKYDRMAVAVLSILKVHVVSRMDGAQKTLLTASNIPTTVTIGKPVIEICFDSVLVPDTSLKESNIRASLSGLTIDATPSDLHTADHLATFMQSPPGVFESVIPTECTRIAVSITEVTIRVAAAPHPGILLLSVEEFRFSTTLIGTSAETHSKIRIPSLTVMLVDDIGSLVEQHRHNRVASCTEWWKSAGYALLFRIEEMKLGVRRETGRVSVMQIVIENMGLGVHLCSDSISAISIFMSNLQAIMNPILGPAYEPTPSNVQSSSISHMASHNEVNSNLLRSLDEDAFKKVPELGPAPDMISDDLPSNPEYLDASYGTAAGFRELSDEEYDDELQDKEWPHVNSSLKSTSGVGVISNVGGETVKMLLPSIHIIDNFYGNLPMKSGDNNSEYGDVEVMLRMHNCRVNVQLYGGYDWNRTRKIIEDERKQIKKRLARIRQLLASGHKYDASMENTSKLLFNSIYVGLEQDVDDFESGALLAAIDENLNEDIDAASQSSWQTLKARSAGHRAPGGQHSRSNTLQRSRAPCIEFCFEGLKLEAEKYQPQQALVSRLLFSVENFEILDHLKTSTWRTFLTSLHIDSHGNVRESGSNMIRVELRMLKPSRDHSSSESEARLKAKILPLRLHVDQDALDFMKSFFSFRDIDVEQPVPTAPQSDIYFQHVEIFPIDIKLDYKPRRVDYRALREGRTIELMNFFHFDGAEMTLRHITLRGVTGWPRLFDLLNDLWTPDVKANQLADVISGVSPIRSAVNVGSGVADLILLPIAQYKKDGRVIRGLQKGTNAFVKSTAMEAIKLGAQLATGTQVILEQAEGVLGGQFNESITTEAFQSFAGDTIALEATESIDLISRYAEQPSNIKEGMLSALNSLSKNIQSAGQTILAVPMEIYERSGTDGPTRAVVRAVPIAVLKPMIGASEAVSKTLLGLRNTMDPDARYQDETKYKQR